MGSSVDVDDGVDRVIVLVVLVYLDDDCCCVGNFDAV